MKLKHLLLAAPLFAGGCAATSPPEVVDLTRSETLFVETGHLHQATPVQAYTGREVTEPGSWRKLNDAQSPDGGGS